MTDRPERRRLLGVDAARAIALAGMIGVHVLPATTDDGTPTFAHQLAAGRASALFAVLAGVGLALATGGPRPSEASGRPGRRRGVVVRCLLVAAIGLCLGGLPSGLAVILTYYGVLFLLCLPVLGWGPRRLAALAVACAVVTLLVSAALRDRVPGSLLSPSWSDLADPGALAWSLVVSGYYPVLTWSTYLFAGLAVGRCDLRHRAVAARVALTGVATAVAALLVDAGARAAAGGSDALAGRLGIDPTDLDEQLVNGSYGTPVTSDPWWLLLAARHSGTPVDLAHTTGNALAVPGGCLLLVPVIGRAGRVVAAAGAQPLTAYTLHVAVRRVRGPDPVG